MNAVPKHGRDPFPTHLEIMCVAPQGENTKCGVQVNRGPAQFKDTHLYLKRMRDLLSIGVDVKANLTWLIDSSDIQHHRDILIVHRALRDMLPGKTCISAYVPRHATGDALRILQDVDIHHRYGSSWAASQLPEGVIASRSRPYQAVLIPQFSRVFPSVDELETHFRAQTGWICAGTSTIQEFWQSVQPRMIPMSSSGSTQ